MSTLNPFVPNGSTNERALVEDLIIETLRMYGNEFYYIPRKLVSKDDILGEDRLSEFKEAYPIEMYFENVDNYSGQGVFIQKFGLMIEHAATLVVARRRWDQFVGRYGETIVPSRPNEGDLIYFPTTDALFEIRFVEHQDPFYQLGKLFVYKLQVELFQYSSENIETGIAEIDAFESLKTFDVDPTTSNYGGVVSIEMTNGGSGYTGAPEVVITSDTGYGATALATLGTGIYEGVVVKVDVISEGENYKTPPTVSFIGDGVGATATASIKVDIDKIVSYGDNNSFKKEALDIVFNEDNPFGE